MVSAAFKFTPQTAVKISAFSSVCIHLLYDRPATLPQGGSTFWYRPVTLPHGGSTFWDDRPVTLPHGGSTFWDDRPVTLPQGGRTFWDGRKLKGLYQHGGLSVCGLIMATLLREGRKRSQVGGCNPSATRVRVPE